MRSKDAILTNVPHRCKLLLCHAQTEKTFVKHMSEKQYQESHDEQDEEDLFSRVLPEKPKVAKARVRVARENPHARKKLITLWISLG